MTIVNVSKCLNCPYYSEHNKGVRLVRMCTKIVRELNDFEVSKIPKDCPL